MMTLTEIEEAISALSEDDRAALRAWLDEEAAEDAWDAQIARDARRRQVGPVYRRSASCSPRRPYHSVVNHHADPRFWRAYHSLSPQLQRAADRAFEALKADASHPSLHFKKVGPGRWSARVTKQFRALAFEDGDDFVWYWIGPHDDYEGFIGGE